MSNTTERQHYVWQYYLKPWLNDPNNSTEILTLNKKTPDIDPKLISTKDVAVSSFTYDMSMITETDRQIFETLFNNYLQAQSYLPISVNLNRSSQFQPRDYIEKNYLSDVETKGTTYLNGLYQKRFPFSCPTISDGINKLKKELLDTIFNGSNGNNFVSLLDKCPGQDEQFDFFEFVFVQYLRTRKQKNALIKKLITDSEQVYKEKGWPKPSKAIFPLSMILCSFMFSNSFCQKGYRVQLLNNSTKINFITGDSPVININEEDYEHKPFFLFYPLTPQLAIICRNDICDNAEVEISEEEVVVSLNKKIFNSAEIHVFAKDPKDFLFN